MAGKGVKRAFIKGLAALLPTMLTIIILVKTYEVISGTVGQWLTSIVVQIIAFAISEPKAVIEPYVPNLVGVVLALVLIFFMGLALAFLIGQRVWHAVEGVLRRIPVINTFYPSLKQLTDFFFRENAMSFSGVVILEYPRKGVYSMGFVTSDAFKTAEKLTGKDMVTVFIPSSPTPFTGYCVQVARSELTLLSISVDAALRYAVSGGVLVPEAEMRAPGAAASAAPVTVKGETERPLEDSHRQE